eukprot:TRINITY_DN1899_c0_g1_i9.p1 TRINITY_DN1899_c0_g1~~TRINITY_DN1899_c0_g1_i9.p1  ORF type:complete len:234 (+),score=49.26 TRINITY_DN1899_c0_g1_i9:206-907(+)
MGSLYVGGIPTDVSQREMEDKFTRYGPIARIEIKRGFAFLEYRDRRDGDDAIRDLDGATLFGEKVRVEWAKGGRPRGPPPSGGDRCFSCGGEGHWARDCRGGGGGGRRFDSYRRDGRDYDRRRSPRRDRRSPSPRRRSPSPRRRSPSPDGNRERDKSPRRRSPSPRKRSPSPDRERDRSPRKRSPSPQKRSPSPRRRSPSPRRRTASPDGNRERDTSPNNKSPVRSPRMSPSD